MKKWSMIMATVMALLVIATVPASALAQTDDNVTTGSAAGLRDGLAIVAPRVALVNTECSITVFKCSDQEPIEGASVWLITRERLEVVRQEMATATGNDGPDADQGDYERLLSIHGTSLGKTDVEGKVWHSFDSEGRYVLIAIMLGYYPDARPIAVGIWPRALAINAPRRAEVDENITITVFQRGTNQTPVKDASVWALTR